MFAERAQEADEAFAGVQGLRVNPVQGAFYVTAMFEPGALGGNQRLPIENPVLSDIVERQCVTAAPDARFVYHLLAAKGICVVPLTGFYSPHAGFRFTLLETDDEKRRWIVQDDWPRRSPSIWRAIGPKGRERRPRRQIRPAVDRS